jgi:hypothetical protein
MSVDVKTELLHYPVLEFSKGMVFPARSVEELEQCSSPALRSGFFNNLMLIDSDGKTLKIVGARKLRSVGPFFGFNIFMNQRIKVALTASGPEQGSGIEDVRRLVLGAIRGRQGWTSMEDIDELAVIVERASSVSEIAAAVTAAYYRKGQRATH